MQDLEDQIDCIVLGIEYAPEADALVVPVQMKTENFPTKKYIPIFWEILNLIAEIRDESLALFDVLLVKRKHTLFTGPRRIQLRQRKV